MDHIVYDNITSSIGGRDWGVKVRTGVLQNRSDLERLFHKYATLVLGNSSIPLSELSPAIGGIPDPERKGYLLCVNVALKDLVGRSSLAIVGFWFTSVTELQRISAEKEDYEEMARKVLVSPHETIKEFTGKIRERCQDEHITSNRPRPVLKEFDSGGKAAESALNLIYSCSAKNPLAVLGATCWFNPQEWECFRFDAVYFHGANSDAQVVLDEYYSGKQGEEEQQTVSISSPHNFILLVVLAFLCSASAYFLIIWKVEYQQKGGSFADVRPYRNSKQNALPHFAEKPPLPQLRKTIPAPPDEQIHKTSDYLIQVEKLMKRLKKYEQSGALKKNSVYQWVNKIDVLPEYKEKRKELLQELDFSYWHRNILSNDILYYFGGSEYEITEKIKEEQVKRRISSKLPDTFCTGLEEAFVAEYKNINSDLVIWCDTMNQLSKLSRE
ncbi:hypothetical protein KKHLCK_03655 [Candidatus Electrothrix laxa]